MAGCCGTAGVLRRSVARSTALWPVLFEVWGFLSGAGVADWDVQFFRSVDFQFDAVAFAPAR